MDQIKVPITTKAFTTASFKPMRRLNIDAIGPLPVSKDGYQHILVIIDTFTRFAELYGIKDVTAKSAARAILQHAGRYGVADQILSDEVGNVALAQCLGNNLCLTLATVA